ncbi:MAG: AAA family ATPase, partial [Thermogutta sp.]|nr:AAA family ATPase [Thermogutta sp.]
MERLSKLRFENFKALRDCTLELGRFNLLIGPNGSGKSTVFQFLQLAREFGVPWQQTLAAPPYAEIVSVEAPPGATIAVEAEFVDEAKPDVAPLLVRWEGGANSVWRGYPSPMSSGVEQAIRSWRFFAFDPVKIQQANTIGPAPSLGARGENLANVLHWLRDEYPDRFAAIQDELRGWLPEFTAVVFKTVSSGAISIQLRMAGCDKVVPASQLSQGTLISLALLTLAHLPEPPGLVCLEEPDRGLHPRLMRQVR